MKQGLVSIIIPVYNSEKYIKRSVRSALAQSYENIEVIVVDDGSTDGTGIKLKKIADPRLKVISSENKGPGAARNIGVRESAGEYILYLDSDDEIVKGAVSRCITEIKGSGVDIVTFNTEAVGSSDTFKPNYKRDIIEGIYSPEEYLKDKTPCVVCLYFFKKEVAEKNRLEFLEGIVHEDRAYTPMLIKAAGNISYIDQVLHTRYIVEDSIMTRKKTIYNIESKRAVIDYLEKNNIDAAFIKHLWWSSCKDILKIGERKERKRSWVLMLETRRSNDIGLRTGEVVKLWMLRVLCVALG